MLKNFRYRCIFIGRWWCCSNRTKLLKKGLGTFQKLGKVEQKQAVRKGVGVPKRKFNLYSGNTHNTPSEWFTDKKIMPLDMLLLADCKAERITKVSMK